MYHQIYIREGKEGN